MHRILAAFSLCALLASGAFAATKECDVKVESPKATARDQHPQPFHSTQQFQNIKECIDYARQACSKGAVEFRWNLGKWGKAACGQANGQTAQAEKKECDVKVEQPKATPRDQHPQPWHSTQYFASAGACAKHAKLQCKRGAVQYRFTTEANWQSADCQ